MEDQKLKKLIKCYLDGTATPAEAYIVDCWLESMQKDHSEEFIEPDATAHQNLAAKIIATTFQHQPKKSFPIWKVLLSSAALIVLIPTVIFYYFGNSNQENKSTPPTFAQYSSGLNQVKRIQLPDSTIVFLNANSSIRIQRQFNLQQERMVAINGEAFFEVKRDVKRPFKVHVGELQVKVLGTSFNIKAYHDLPDIKIAVSTGKVNVSRNGNALANLIPNDALTYNKATRLYTTLSEDINRNAWKNGTVTLYKASFTEVSVAFFNIYGSHLVTEDTKLLSEHYNVTLRSTRSENQTLTHLSEIFNQTYRKEGSKRISF